MVWLSEEMVFSLSFLLLNFLNVQNTQNYFFIFFMLLFFLENIFQFAQTAGELKIHLMLLFCWELIFSRQYDLVFCSSYQMKTTILICNLFSLSGILVETPFYYTQGWYLTQWDAQISSAIGLYVHWIIKSATVKWNKTDILFCLIIIWMIYFQSNVQVLSMFKTE